MNDKKRIEVLESMLTEERDKGYHVLGILESYARGLDMMARTVYAEAPAGSRDEKNASALKQHTTDMVAVLAVKADELRGLMGRSLPSGQEKAQVDEAPEPPAFVEEAGKPQGITIH